MTECLFILTLPQPHVTFLVALLCCFTQRGLTRPHTGIKGEDLRLWAWSQTFLGRLPVLTAFLSLCKGYKKTHLQGLPLVEVT